jgi:hypothetical protein
VCGLVRDELLILQRHFVILQRVGAGREAATA